MISVGFFRSHSSRAFFLDDSLTVRQAVTEVKSLTTQEEDPKKSQAERKVGIQLIPIWDGIGGNYNQQTQFLWEIMGKNNNHHAGLP